MKRRELLRAALGVGAASLVPAHVLAATSSPHILMLTYRGETDVERGFRDYLASAGVNARITHRDANRNLDVVRDVLAELPTLKPDLIYTWGTSITLEVVGRYDAPDPQGRVTDIPVVFALVSAPVQVGLAPSFASSGRNLTGAVHVVPTDVQMRAMQAYKPFSRVGVLYTPTEQNSLAIVDEARAFCAQAGATLIEHTFDLDADGRPTDTGVAAKVQAIAEAGADWLYLLPDTFLGTVYDIVTPAALAAGLPTFGAAELAIRQGGALVGLVSRYYSVGQLAGQKAVDILVNGTSPADIPIETLKRFSLIINMPVAKALGAYPPISMLDYAEVITG